MRGVKFQREKVIKEKCKVTHLSTRVKLSKWGNTQLTRCHGFRRKKAENRVASGARKTSHIAEAGKSETQHPNCTASCGTRLQAPTPICGPGYVGERDIGQQFSGTPQHSD